MGDAGSRFFHAAIFRRPDFLFLQTAMEPFDVTVALRVMIRRASVRDAQRPVTPTCLRDVPALDTFLHDLPLLFRGSIYAWFPARVASCFGGPELT